jgi:hypothetical protein
LVPYITYIVIDTLQESVDYAKKYYRHISPAFLNFLETKNLDETHNIADASLFVLMTLEETQWYLSFTNLSVLMICVIIIV